MNRVIAEAGGHRDSDEPHACLPDADRFHSDTVGEEHLRRKAQYERKVQINEARRRVSGGNSRPRGHQPRSRLSYRVLLVCHHPHSVRMNHDGGGDMPQSGELRLLLLQRPLRYPRDQLAALVVATQLSHGVTARSVPSVPMCLPCRRLGFHASDQERMQREGKRWEDMERKDAQERDQWDRLREDGEKAKKNRSGLPYNMISLR